MTLGRIDGSGSTVLWHLLLEKGVRMFLFFPSEGVQLLALETIKFYNKTIIIKKGE